MMTRRSILIQAPLYMALVELILSKAHPALAQSESDLSTTVAEVRLEYGSLFEQRRKSEFAIPVNALQEDSDLDYQLRGRLLQSATGFTAQSDIFSVGQESKDLASLYLADDVSIVPTQEALDADKIRILAPDDRE